MSHHPVRRSFSEDGSPELVEGAKADPLPQAGVKPAPTFSGLGVTHARVMGVYQAAKAVRFENTCFVNDDLWIPTESPCPNRQGLMIPFSFVPAA